MYTWNAEDYARHSQGQERWARELLEQLRLTPDDRVLDVGCGDGRITAEIARRVPRGSVVGVDSSPEMVRHAVTHHAPSQPNLSFREADARALPFTEAFSVVFSNAALHWVRDHAPVMAGLAQALAPGGRMLLQMGGCGNGLDVIRTVERVMARPRWAATFDGFQSPYGFHRPELYERGLGQLGLEVQEARLIRKDMVHADRAAFVGWLRTAWHPYVDPVAAQSRSAFIDEVTDAYLARHPPDASGGVHVGMVRLQIQARKPGVRSRSSFGPGACP